MLPTFLKINIVSLLIIASFKLNAQSNAISVVGRSSSEQYSKLNNNGMAFTPNKGQIVDMEGKVCPDVLYKSEAAGADIYLRATGISYVQTNRSAIMHKAKEQVEDLLKAGIITRAEEHTKKDALMQKEQLKVHRVDMDFEGANKNCRLIDEGELQGYQNYYYSHCPQGITNVHQYNKVTYKNIYKGIDVSYYGSSEQGLKYDLIVQPHANPNQIKLHWKGAKEIEINPSAGSGQELKVESSLGTMTETLPKVYQVINGKVIDVKTNYVLTPIANGEAIINFSFNIYNSSFPLIIDPWATYYGGIRSEFSTSIASDKVGNAVITGYLSTTVGLPIAPGPITIPVTPGTFQSVYGGGQQDAFVAKFGLVGNCIWATFYGGSGIDRGMGVTTDNLNNVIVTGFTAGSALDLPLQTPAGAYSQPYGGNGDAFIAKFNPAGLLTWASFYGGNTLDSGFGIVTDNNNNMIITGGTQSATIPGSTGVSVGSVEAYVIKFTSANTLAWAVMYGGTSVDYGFSIATDMLNNIVITGYTTSVDLPIIASGSMYSQAPAGFSDAFVVKFNTVGVPVWATYFGGNGAEYSSQWFNIFNTYPFGGGIATDNLGNIIIAGVTNSPTLPVTTAVGAAGAFLVKFNSSNILQWATYVPGCDVGIFVAIDSYDYIYLLMEKEDVPAPNIVDPCAYQQQFNGGSATNTTGNYYVEDQIIAKYKPTGEKVCSTYLGGTGEDELDFGGGIAIHNASIVVTGVTDGGYPTTIGAFQNTFAGPAKPGWGVNDGGTDVFVTSICVNICEGKNLAINFSDNAVTKCTNEPIKFTPAVTNSCDTTGYRFRWEFAGGSPAVSDSVNPTVSFPSAGTHDVKLTVTTLCKIETLTKSAYINTVVCTPPCLLAAQFAKGTATCANCGCKEWVLVNVVNGSPPYTYLWSDGYDKRYKNKICPGNYTVKVTDKNGCSVDVNVSTP